MRAPPLEQLKRSYRDAWEAVLGAGAAGEAAASAGAAPATDADHREVMLCWDRVLSLPPPAAAAGAGMRCF